MNSNQKLPQPKKIEVTDVKALKLMGCVYYGDPFHSNQEWSTENEIGVTWNRFHRLCYLHEEILCEKAIGDVAYEVHIQPDDYKETGKFYVYVGVEVKKLDEMPLEMFAKTLPPTKYAVFTYKGEDMFNGGTYIWSEWLPSSEYEESYPYMLQAYDKSRFRGLDDPESEVDFYVPVKLR
ncbi:GyrI-like domain-containing protein [Methanobacterium alcaliphilum]|uniref:GyrI-like domain-containing protein n=1 Tax=Methanobacterium alcaliphilum TaxID=392018 RepID=UPI002009FB83|nr:GyrI-like domain-containing protein [Methanobacterium alcaliphilum]MCK9152280.1 GyrI-like domain-containing protein [Methanobacterium alcaliphilum]